MRILIAGVLLASACWGAIGDNAIPVPANWKTAHPHLPYPDNTYLQGICTNNGNPGGVTNAGDGCAMVSRFRSAANGASPTSLQLMRYQLIAYAATKWNGTPNAALLTKIKAYSSNYGIASAYVGAFALAMAYDWFHADICASDGGTIVNGACVGSSNLNTMRSTLYTIENSYFNSCWSSSTKPSPYNDILYITGCAALNPFLVSMAAVYPDDAATSLPLLRKGLDVVFNIMIPSWKTVFGEYPFASAATSPVGGGGWHEGWSSDYVVKSLGIPNWILPNMKAWASATQKGDAYVFGTDTACATNKQCQPDQFPWIKNFGFFSMYMQRPDWVAEPIGNSNSRFLFQYEYSGTPTGGNNAGSTVGFIDGVAELYNDSVLRGWSRLINWNNSVPDGNEPTCWPFCSPDSSAKTAVARTTTNTASVKDFPGWGTTFFRTGFGEDDTYCTVRYGPSFWSHTTADAGAFTCFNRGQLALRSADYRGGSLSFNTFLWAGRAISQNTFLVYDPADRYSDETYPICGPSNTNCGGGSLNDFNAVPQNDGGQRPVGSTYSNLGNMSGLQQSPFDAAHWGRGREFTHAGRQVGFAVHPSGKYAFLAVDTTASYNNRYSLGAHTGAWNPYQRNTSNRSPRVQKAVRQFIWIPRGQAAYFIVYDQVISTDSAFTKKWLLHSINQPVIPNPAFPSYARSAVISRTELVTSTYNGLTPPWPAPWSGNMTHCPGGCTGGSSTQYQYNGRMYVFNSWPTTGSLTTVGGPGAEFAITDSSGTVNYNACMFQQCASDFGSVSGRVAAPWTITAGSNDKFSIAVDGGATQAVTLAPGVGLSCASVAADLNSKVTGATFSCEGMTTPLSYLGIRANGTVKTSCPGPSASCSGFAVIAPASNSSLATLGFDVAAFCSVGWYGLGTSTCTQTTFVDEGLNAIGGYIHPLNTKAPAQPGAWRIEGLMGASSLSDQAVNVHLVTSANDTNLVTTAPVTTQVTVSGVASLQTTWKDNADQCIYTLTQPVDGVGGTLTMTGTCQQGTTI